MESIRSGNPPSTSNHGLTHDLQLLSGMFPYHRIVCAPLLSFKTVRSYDIFPHPRQPLPHLHGDFFFLKGSITIQSRYNKIHSKYNLVWPQSISTKDKIGAQIKFVHNLSKSDKKQRQRMVVHKYIIHLNTIPAH